MSTSEPVDWLLTAEKRNQLLFLFIQQVCSVQADEAKLFDEKNQSTNRPGINFNQAGSGCS